MASEAEIKQLAKELEAIVRNGVRRPLPKDKSEADIALLAEIARELADDPTLPLSQLIAEAVHPAVRRTFTDKRQAALAELLDIDLRKKPNDPTLPVTRRLLDEDRRVKIRELMGWSGTGYDRNAREMEKEALLKPLGEQLLVLRDVKQRAVRRPDPVPATEDALEHVQPPVPALPIAQESAEPPLGRRLLVGGVGLLLSVVGVVWLVVQLVNG